MNIHACLILKISKKDATKRVLGVVGNSHLCQATNQ